MVDIQDNSGNVLGTTEVTCPCALCFGTATLRHKAATLEYKGKAYNVMQYFWRCRLNPAHEFTDDNLDTITLKQIPGYEANT